MEYDTDFDPYAAPLLMLPDAVHLIAYTKQAFGRYPTKDPRLLVEFEHTLERHELLTCGCVEESLTDRVEGLFSPSLLNRAGIDDVANTCMTTAWKRPLAMSLALLALDEPLDEFLGRAVGFEAMSGARLASMVYQVHDLAPAAAAKMAEEFCQITTWSLADRLSPQLGSDFLSNFVCRSMVRSVLENHIENLPCYGDRAVQMMFDYPESLSGYTSFRGAMRSFRLDRLLAVDESFHRNARRAFRDSRSRLA